jgi:hypothetical protein
MRHDLSAVAFVKSGYALLFVDSLNHQTEHQFFLCGVDQGVSCEQHLHGVEQSGCYKSRGYCVEQKPPGARASKVPDDLEELELNGGVQCFTDEVNSGGSVQSPEAFFALNFLQSLK